MALGRLDGDRLRLGNTALLAPSVVEMISMFSVDWKMLTKNR